MSRASNIASLYLFAAALLLGCDGPPSGSTAAPSAPAEAPVAAPVAPPAPQAPAAPPEMVREQATVGVGKHGGDVPVNPTAVDIITTPTNVYFAAKEQLAFNVQVPQALDLYKASEGHSPRSEEEFFDKIIKANQIRLPELPTGHRYVYDVEKEQLQVEHPK